jgi:FkbM family methyltransferase
VIFVAELGTYSSAYGRRDLGNVNKMANWKKSITKRVLRPTCEWMGIPRYTPKYALNDLDDRLAKYLNFRGGVFVEAGANNGVDQSNTRYLEQGRRWTGVLVEAIPTLYNQCKHARPRSKTFHAGLVSSDFTEPTLRMNYANLMSVAEGTMEPEALEEHVKKGVSIQNLEDSYAVDVPARTFASILDEAGLSRVDFLSLDLEGYELEALKGWDFEKIRPRFVLIEVRDLKVMDAFMVEMGYERIDKLTVHDFLYKDRG